MPEQPIAEFASQVRDQLAVGYGLETFDEIESLTDLHGQEKAKFGFRPDSELWFRYAPDGGIFVDLIKKGTEETSALVNGGFLKIDPPI